MIHISGTYVHEHSARKTGSVNIKTIVVVCNRMCDIHNYYADNEFLLGKLPLVPLSPVSLSKKSLKPSSSIALSLAVQRMRSAEKDIVAT